MTTRVAWDTPTRRKHKLLPLCPTVKELHAVYKGTEPPFPGHGRGIRRRAQRRCTPIAETVPSESGWKREFCVCGGTRWVRANPDTGQKTRWRDQNTPVPR